MATSENGVVCENARGIVTRNQLKAGGEVPKRRALKEVGQEKDATKGQEEGAKNVVSRYNLRSRAAKPTQADDAAHKKSLSSVLEKRSQQRVAIHATLSPPRSPMPDIDSSDAENPLMASEYASDIFSYYKRVEPRYRVTTDYMKHQENLVPKFRAILVDWLTEVHYKFGLMSESIYLCVNLLDRYLAKNRVHKNYLQLVGSTALLIATKYEEIMGPCIDDLVAICDNAYTREAFLKMERHMLNSLKFQVTVPTTFHFLCRHLKAAGVLFNRKTAFLAFYLSELALVSYELLQFPYSMIAAASVYVALRTLGHEDVYPHELRKHSGYELDELRFCAAYLVALQQKAPLSSCAAVYKKYCHERVECVAKVSPCYEIRKEANDAKKADES